MRKHQGDASLNNNAGNAIRREKCEDTPARMRHELWTGRERRIDWYNGDGYAHLPYFDW